MTRIQRSDWLVRVTYSSIQVFKSRDWKPTVLTHSTADELVEIFAEVNWVEPLLYGTGNWTVLELCQILLHWLEELPEQTSTNKKTVLTPRDTNQPIRTQYSHHVTQTNLSEHSTHTTWHKPTNQILTQCPLSDRSWRKRSEQILGSASWLVDPLLESCGAW